MNKRAAGALFAAVAALAGCAGVSRESREKNPAPCPNILVLEDASRIIEFDGEQTLEDVAYTGEIVHVESTCRYFGDEPINADVRLDIAFGRGPKGADPERNFEYFVAVTRTNSDVIAKQNFVVPVKFGESKEIVVASEEIDKILIPRAGEEISGVNFEIVVGFNLTASQAIFNRSGKSLKFPNLK